MSRPTQVAAPRLQVAPTGVSPSPPGVSTPFGFPEGGPWPLLLPRACLDTHGLGSSLFARRYSGNRFFLSSPPGTEMFQFPGFAPAKPVTGLQPAGLPHSEMRGSVHACKCADQFMLADPRAFSQLAASFFASGSLGIHRPPCSRFSL